MKTHTMRRANKSTQCSTHAHDSRAPGANGAKHVLVGIALALAVMIPHWTLAATPEVDNADGASNVLSVSAVLSGTLISTGGLPTQVYAYWGETDGGTNTVGSWGHTNDMGTNTVGPLSLEVTHLWPNRMYYYRFYATNQDGEAWASATTTFQTLTASGPAPIDLGSCSNFTILAAATVTTTGGGIINGNVAIFPVGSQGIPQDQINGTIHNGDAIAAQAHLDLDAAILAASPAQLPGGINAGAELGGKTLVAGVYTSPAGSYGITLEDLTLSGGPNDVWVFQMASTLTVGVGRKVILSGGAQAKNIFWQVGSSATLLTSCVFKGNIMAYASITMNASSTMDGRALAQTGAVTFNGSSGSLPALEAPSFAQVSRTNSNSVTLVLNTTPYFLLTLKTSPDLYLPLANWTTIATNTPVVSPWTFTDPTAMVGVTQRFYQVFITP